MTTEPTAATPGNSAALIGAIGTALEAERWARIVPRTPPPDMSAAMWTSPDRTTRVVITSAPGEPPMADITGHPAGGPVTAVWSLSITDPSEPQILTAARAAADTQLDLPYLDTVRLGDVLHLVDRLQHAGWILHSGDASSGELFRLSQADAGRWIIRTDSDDGRPGGWMLEGHDLRADATEGTPSAVLAALAAVNHEPAATCGETPAAPS